MSNKGTVLAISFVVISVIAGTIILGLQTSSLGKVLYLGNDFSGSVLNPVGVPLVGAKVYLVPTTVIDMTPITASDIYNSPYRAESYDEPIEDAIRSRGDGILNVITNIDGKFIFSEVPDGKFFIYVIPSSQDIEHLPGGDRSRISYAAETLRGMTMNIKVSSSPPSNAIYIGSSTCIGCHPQRQSIKQTGHKLSWSVPDSPGGLQDYTRFPDFFKSLQRFREVSNYNNYKEGTHLELGDYDVNRKADKFDIREFNDARLPIEKIYFDVYLWKKKDGNKDNNSEKYFITIENRLNPNDPKSPSHLEVKLRYGGAVHRDNFIVSIPPNLGGDRKGSYVVLQYNPDGDDKRFNRDRRVWKDLYFDQFWDPGSDNEYGTKDDTFKAPPINDNTIEAMCDGCHINGYERYKDEKTGQYLVRAANDQNGELNIDDDPEKDEINVGCERCHGPGSMHKANPGRYIVNPKSLSAERSAVICGRCHDRREGVADMAGMQPLNKEGMFMKPGESRNTLLTEYSSPGYKGPKPGEDVWPDDIFSKKPSQQYSDFIKSKLYRNDRILLACTDCHNPHGGTPNRRLLLHDPDNSSSSLCQRCHIVDIKPHMESRFGQMMKGSLTLCIDCHMPGTAIEMQGGIYGAFVNKPPYNSSVEENSNVYWQGQINSHTFKVPFKKDIAVRGVEPGESMPIPFTNTCGTCHTPFIYKLPYK